MAGDTLVGYLIRLKPNDEDNINIPVLGRSFLIGRSGECQIRLKNIGVSERHCKIQVSQLEKVTVHRLDPDYPVYVNEKEINSDGHSLQQGDILKLADLSFRWQRNNIPEHEEISKNAAHLSFCCDGVSKVTPRKRQSAPAALFKDNTIEFDDFPENSGTIMPEEPVKEDSTSKNEIDANKEEYGNVSTRIDSEEDSFSDALGTEEISTSLEDNLISEISENHKIIENDTSSSTLCRNTPSKTATNLSLVQNKSMTRNNQTKDDDEDNFEDSASNLDEIFDLNNEETQDLMLTTEDSSHFDENVSRRDITASFVNDPNECARTSNITTPQLLEQTECPTPVLRSRRKSQKGLTPQKDAAVVNGKNFEEISHLTDSTLTTNNIIIPNHTTPPRDDSNIEDVQNSILKTPKCFEEAYHSTPNKLHKEAPSNIPSKSLIENTPEVVESPGKFRYRRSTGIGTQVGTPSEEYRCKRSILTPAIRQSRDSALKETEISSTKVLPRRRSSERKSTPIKARFSDRSMMRESIVPSPIMEDEASEKCEESQNESLTNDTQFKNVQMRRQRRYRGSSFVNENKILEESETSLKDMTDGQLDDLNEEEEEDKSLMALSSCDDSVLPMSARIIINGDRSGNDNEENSELNSTFTIDSTEAPKEDSCVKEVPCLKSILTPLPTAPLSMKEKSVKKVTFAHSVVEEAYERSSIADSQFVDSYTLGSQQSSYNSLDASETSSNLYSKIEDGLESFCDNEELLISQRSQSSIFSQNSSSTPVKLSNNTPVSSEKLKGVTRCLNEWDKSFESSRTRRDSKNEQSSTACLTDISMDDNVDLTALQDAENKCNKNRVSSNKTIEQSMNSTREITDEFVTPSESKLIESIGDCSVTKESRVASTPMNAATIAEEDEQDSETFVSFADLLKTPCAASSKLNKTVESEVDNSQIERSKSSTGVTPQLEQLRINKTLNSTFGTPFVKSNKSVLSTKGTPCLKLNDVTTSTPNYETNASLTPNVKGDKNAGSFVRTPLPKLSRTGTPHPKMSKCSDSLKSLLDWKFNRSVNMNMSANKSKLSNIDKSLKSTANTPRQDSLSLDKTSNSAKCSTYSRQNSLNKSVDRSEGIHRSVVNFDETVHNLEDITELQEATNIEEDYQLSLKTSDNEEEDLPGDESSTGIDLMITKSPEETPGSEVSNNSQSGSESEVFEDAVTQDISEEKAIEEAETQMVAPVDVCEFEPLEELDTQYTSSLETEAQRDAINELETLEDADTQNSFSPERETIEEAETQAVEINEVSVNDILQEAETQDLETDDVPVNDILEEAKTQAVEIDEISMNDILQDAETQDLETDGLSENHVLEEAETQALEMDRASVNDILEEAETQELGEVSVNSILEEAETQDVLEFDNLEEAETQAVTENATAGQVSEVQTLEEVDTQYSSEFNIDTERNSPDIFDGEVIEEADTQITVDEAIEDADTQDASEFCPIEEAATQDVSEGGNYSQNNSINEAIEEAETQFNLERETEESPIEEIATQLNFEGPAVQDVISETTTQDVSSAVQVTTEETPSQTSIQSALESCLKYSVPDIMIDGGTPDISLIEETATQNLVEAIEEAETQNIFDDTTRQEAVEEAETQDIAMEGTEERGVETTEQIIENRDLEEATVSLSSETDPAEGNQTTEESILEDVPKSEIVETVTELADTNDHSIVSDETESSERKKSVAETISESTSDISNVIPASANEEVLDASECPIPVADTTLQAEESKVQKRVSNVEKVREQRKSVPRPSQFGILLSPTESPALRRSHRISHTENPIRVSRSIVAAELKPTRSSSRRTPMKFLETDLEKSASKKSWKDRHNQENELRASPFHRECSLCDSNPARENLRNNDEGTPARRLTQTPLRKTERKSTLKKSEVQDMDSNQKMTTRKSSPPQTAKLSTGTKRRALIKLDSNTEIIQTPSKTAQSRLNDSVSPVSIVLPVLEVTSAGIENAVQTLPTPVKVDNDRVSMKPKRTSKRGKDLHPEIDAKVSPDTNKRARKQKDSVESNTVTLPVKEQTNKRGRKNTSSVTTSPASTTSSILGSPKRTNAVALPVKEQTNKRGRKKTSSVVTSPASTTSSIVGSPPKRATRKRRLEEDEASSGASPAKRALRGRRVAAPIEEIPSRPKRAIRGSQEKLNECVTEVRSKRAKTVVDVASVLVESTNSAVEVQRTNRSKRNADVLEENVASEKKPTTRSNRQKTSPAIEGPSTSKRGVKNRQPVVAEIEEESEPDDEVVVKKVPAGRRAARNRQTVIAENEAKAESDGKAVVKRGARNRRAVEVETKEKSESEGEADVKEAPASRRGARNRRAVETGTTAKSESDSEAAVKEVPAGRRGARNRQAVETEITPKTESDAKADVKKAPAGRRGTRNVQVAVVETESSNARSIRGKRAAPVKETTSKRPARQVVKNEVEEDEIATLPDRIKANRRSTSLVNTEVLTKKSTRSRTTRPEAVSESTSTTVRSTRSKKGPSLTVARKSMTLKVVRKTSEGNSDEPRSKRVKICEPGEEVSKKSTKATIKRRETTTTMITKSDGSRSVTRRSCLKKTTVAKSPVTKITTRTTKGAETKTKNSATTSRTTRRK